VAVVEKATLDVVMLKNQKKATKRLSSDRRKPLRRTRLSTTADAML